jgi:hypothetical protein
MEQRVGRALKACPQLLSVIADADLAWLGRRWVGLQMAAGPLVGALTHAEADADKARISSAEMSDLGRTVMSWTWLQEEG